MGTGGRVGGGAHIEAGVEFFRGRWCAVRKDGGHRDFATFLSSHNVNGTLKSKGERGGGCGGSGASGASGGR